MGGANGGCGLHFGLVGRVAIYIETWAGTRVRNRVLGMAMCVAELSVLSVCRNSAVGM
jgi:hypothetical protein